MRSGWRATLSPSGPRCGAAAAGGAGRTWPSPATSPSWPSICWRTSSWPAASWAPAPGWASPRGARPWGTSGCRCTRAPGCSAWLLRSHGKQTLLLRLGPARRRLNMDGVGGVRGEGGEQLMKPLPALPLLSIITTKTFILRNETSKQKPIKCIKEYTDK